MNGRSWSRSESPPTPPDPDSASTFVIMSGFDTEFGTESTHDHEWTSAVGTCLWIAEAG